jgi:cell division protein FtsL
VALLDRVLRGPAYIAVVGLLLAGIVFFNVDVLELNHGIARTDVRSSQLKRENAALTLKLAKLGSSERIQRVALQNGLVLPQPGDVRYLRADRQDAERALRVMTAPDSSSAAPVTPALLSQQSTPTPQSASTTPSSTVTPAQTGTTTAPTTTTAAPTTTTTTTTPATQTTPSTTAPASTTTPAGATAAPATTAQTTP